MVQNQGHEIDKCNILDHEKRFMGFSCYISLDFHQSHVGSARPACLLIYTMNFKLDIARG